MFTKIGESKWMKVVLFITTFAFVGTALVALIVYKLSGRISGAAEVNGREISMQRYMYEINIIQSNLERQGVDVGALRKAIHRQALQNIISEELLYQEAEKEGVVATKEEVKEALLNIPSFQENGRFSKEKYLAIVNSLGVSPQFFEEILRRELTKEHIFSLIRGATYISKDEINTVMKKELSRITGEIALIKPSVKVSEKEMKEFYSKNSKMFAGKKGKKVVVYKIDINKTGKEKGANLAKSLFLKLKNNQPVEKTEGIEEIYNDVFYKEFKLKGLPKKVVDEINSISENKKIAFVRTEDAYYLAKLEKIITKPMPFEKVKDQIKSFLERKKQKEAIKKIVNEINKEIKKGVSLKEIAKKYKGKIEKIKELSLKDLVQKYSIPFDFTSMILKVKTGKLSKPIPTQKGVVIIKVDKISISKDEKSKDTEAILKKVIFNEKTNDLINAYINKLYRKAEIKINPRLSQ